jgi:NADH-quinone oxidoreductase subunit H
MLEIIITIVMVLLSVVFLILAERMVMAGAQRRKGPNQVGWFGILQAVADGVKLVFKEVIVPAKSNSFLFLAASITILFTSLSAWIFIPFSETNYIVNFDWSLLFLYAISSLGAFGIILAGWSSNSRYAFLGSIRSTAQLISYEVFLGLIFLTVALCSNSFNLIDIVKEQAASIWYFIPLFPVFCIFFISILAETNRAPFDLPEAEAEIVAGYNIEYSSLVFAMFFLAEYNNILVLSTLMSICFLGGWLFPFGLLPASPVWLFIKVSLICFTIIAVRTFYPRYRYDTLMKLGWENYLLITLTFFVFAVGILYV